MVEVPQRAYYGSQTARAIENFQISGISIGHYPLLIRALALVKKAAARANCQLGDLSEAKMIAIGHACDDIAAGHLSDQFALDVFQGGAGTSTNMNINEVIANRGLETMGLPRGNYAALHPNDDVNRSQSTNDVYPTAIRLALLLAAPELIDALWALIGAFESKALEFAHILKLGRTQLQDAVPMTLGQEFGAFAITVREDIDRLREAMDLLREINLGGTAIGTGITADPGYQRVVVAELEAVAATRLKPAANLIEAGWDTGAFVHFSAVLKRVAVKLSKISNDLRLLSSGPRGGIGEVRLPAVQPGSSIMPGKVNPVIPEVVNQVAFHVIGQDVTVTLAAEAGQLRLNAFEPIIVFSLMQSIRLLTNAARVLETRCVADIKADEAACGRHLLSGTALATALVPVLGYERSAELVEAILASGKTLRELLIQADDLSPDLIDDILNAEEMTRPSRARKAKT
ncbi:aspartate ammonia-lyase [Mesorhizobium sp. AR02]|uniref:aspartate ammonia-lyase n=1 Tax=Mesorhizobium sp. AR02 TaxID=2865837 RepID=UPI00215DD6D4|nr:aspartate ammonia-lyase [Mesorhizobium sp. AR02]UVK54564.1 aspartate ammonia-lyase [Mesorhizobium sp. AR02]